MTELEAADFTEFFRRVRGQDPFPWQTDLTSWLIDERVPSVIDVPTGFGKTSVILCWAFALAVQADRDRLGLARRLFFVVDRRLVVDDAFAEAERLVAALTAAREEPDGVVARVARALSSLHAGDAAPLTAVRMRGGTTWDSRWLARPDQAAVIIGTVDQFGSRLLFRGYGVSDGMRPINAALVGIDAWLVVDEAHIAEPLRQTVESVVRYQQLTEAHASTGLRPLRYTVMSATVDSNGAVAFRPDPHAQSDASGEAQRRLGARKPAALVDLPALASAPRGQWRSRADQLGRQLAALAAAIASGPVVVGVVANTISTARAAFEALDERGETALLLIGRVREYERERLLGQWMREIGVGAERTRDRPLFVVATQTIEVGANVDFDALVTECAPLSALIQRFGRVNRIGRRPTARSLIVHAGFAHSDQDPIYGAATAQTWDYLTDQPASVVEVRKAVDPQALLAVDAVEFGLLAARALADAAPEGVRAEAPFTPIALGAHFERWATTSPAPEPDQPVAPFLHGAGRDVPEVSVAWRAAPPEGGDGEEHWQAWLELVPLVDWEFVAVPIWEVQSLLASTVSPNPVADVEGALAPPEAEPVATTASEALGIVYRGRNEAPSIVRGPADIRAGDRLVLTPSVGGHDEWGWTGRRAVPGDPVVADVGDLAPTRRRSVLRLAQGVLSTLVTADDTAVLDAALDVLDDEDIEDSAGRVVATLQAGLAADHPLRALLDVGSWAATRTEFTERGRPVVLLTARTRGTATDAFSDEDEGSTSQVGAPVSIEMHGRDTADLAREFADHVGVPQRVASSVALAARLHDIGKADRRFQVMLHEGDVLAAAAATEPLAKSARGARHPNAHLARQRAGLPRRFRHEAASGRLFDALRAAAPESFDEVDLELVRHLIVSHHGHSRPLLPPVLDRSAPGIEATVAGTPLSLEGAAYQVDWAQPDRFEALCERYGWWGLAYLETLVRLADMLSSERATTSGRDAPLGSAI